MNWSLQPGDLVTTVHIPNHGGDCFRLYNFSNELGSPNWKKMTDKLYHGEVGLLLEISIEGMGLVLSPRAKTGWVNMANIEAARK
jgi:hypothetical protein